MFDKGLAGQTIARSIALTPGDGASFTITNDVGTNPAIPVGGASFGSIWAVSVTTATSLTAYASADGLAASALPLSSSGSAVTISCSAAGWVELPSACLSVPFLHLETDAGTIVLRLFTKG